MARYQIDLQNKKCLTYKSINCKNEIEGNVKKINTMLYPEIYCNLINKESIIKKNKEPVIGVFINALDNRYEPLIWEGMKKGIKDYYGNLLCFVGGSINNPHYNNNTKNKVFELASKINLDGIISNSASLSSFINNNKLQTFLNKYNSIPILNIGVKLNNMSSIVINNEHGMEKLITHLIEVHGYSRIAIICGPENNRDSIIRLRVYKKILKKYNIPINPDLIVKGDFYNTYGQKAVSLLLDDRKVKFDALIGSNDFVAINAIKELTKRGLNVPKDIAVVGFDDVVEASLIKQSLTTVYQPCFDLGYLAVKKMLSILSGGKKLNNVNLQSRLVIRKSCGCNCHTKSYKNKKIFHAGKNLKFEVKDLTFESYVALFKNLMKKNFMRISTKEKISVWSKMILSILWNDIDNHYLFLKTLRKIINNSLKYKISPETWYKVINRLFTVIIPQFKNNIGNKQFILFFKTMKMISKMVFKNSKYPFIESNDKDDILLTLKKKLQTVIKIEQLKEYAYKFLPVLGIKNFYIFLFDNENKSISQDNSYVIAGYKDYNYVNIDLTENFSFDYTIFDILKNKNSNHLRFIFALNYNNKLLGYSLYEIENNTSRASEIYSSKLDKLLEFISDELSNALHGIFLYKNVKKQTVNYQMMSSEYQNMQSDYRNFNLPEKTAQKYFRKLLNFMEYEKPYKDPELSLIQLAEYLGMTRNHLSYVINVYAGIKFYDFINSYRLNDAKKYLKLDESKKNNMLDIAYDSGFKSKSTFNKIFKKMIKMTPSEFRNKNL